jgi:hypothetical protein
VWSTLKQEVTPHYVKPSFRAKSRSLLNSCHSSGFYQALKTALVIGLGGLGGTAALYLAVAGVGRSILVRGGEGIRDVFALIAQEERSH